MLSQDSWERNKMTNHALIVEGKELVKAFEKSRKSLKEIIEFMNGDADEED